MACAEQKLFMVREYIKMGAPVNWVSPNGFTPLYYAAGMKSPKPYYVCGSVMRRDDFGMERHWLKKGRVMGQKGSPELVEFLIQNGANVNHVSHRVASADPVCKGWQMYPLDDQVCEQWQMCPLDVAVRWRCLSIVRLLVQAGADPMCKGLFAETAYEQSIRQHKQDVTLIESFVNQPLDQWKATVIRKNLLRHRTDDMICPMIARKSGEVKAYITRMIHVDRPAVVHDSIGAILPSELRGLIVQYLIQ